MTEYFVVEGEKEFLYIGDAETHGHYIPGCVCGNEGAKFGFDYCLPNGDLAHLDMSMLQRDYEHYVIDAGNSSDTAYPLGYQRDYLRCNLCARVIHLEQVGTNPDTSVEYATVKVPVVRRFPEMCQAIFYGEFNGFTSDYRCENEPEFVYLDGGNDIQIRCPEHASL